MVNTHVLFVKQPAIYFVWKFISLRIPIQGHIRLCLFKSGVCFQCMILCVIDAFTIKHHVYLISNIYFRALKSFFLLYSLHYRRANVQFSHNFGKCRQPTRASRFSLGAPRDPGNCYEVINSTSAVSTVRCM